jgi:DNA-directed RNA polymerase specialized sigma subunit
MKHGVLEWGQLHNRSEKCPVKKTTELNEKRRAVHQAIQELTKVDPLKRPPTQRELARELGISQARVYQHLVALKELGLVNWTPGEGRSLRILKPLPKS